MATITKQTIKVDLTPGRVYPVLHVSQGDVGLEALEFYIYQNGQPYPIPSEVTAINIDGMTPVGVFSYACTWTGNIVTAGVTATMTAERGIDICELALYDDTNNKVGTCNFIIAVEESPFTNAHVSDSDMATIMAAATEVQQNALLSKSWAVGDTGIRTGENTNNSEYWAELSESWAVGETGKRTGEDTNNSEYWSTVSHQYANTISFKTYDTVAQMKADTGLLDGGVCRTLGYYAADDGGGALYKIKTVQSAIHNEILDNGLYATLLVSDLGINLGQIGVVCDGTTDNTAKITALLSNLETAQYRGYCIVPKNCKYNLTTVTNAVPTGVFLFNPYNINFYYSGTYKEKIVDLYSGDTEDDDAILMLRSGHHPALYINNMGTENSDSGQKKRASILFGDGVKSDGTPSGVFMEQSNLDTNNSLYNITLIGLKSGSGTATDTTLFNINENGRVSINAIQNVDDFNVSNNSSRNTSGTTRIRFVNNIVSGFVELIKSVRDASNNIANYVEKISSSMISTEFKGVKLKDETENYIMDYRWKSPFIRTISGATPTIDHCDMCYVNNSSPTTMTNITATGGPRLMKLTLYFNNNNTTVKHQNFILKNATDWTPSARSTLTLFRDTSVSGAWIEIGRSEM